MQDRKEIVKQPVSDGASNAHSSVSNFGTPYFLSNLALKTGVISFSVSALTQPFQSLLTNIQLSKEVPSALSGGFYRSMYRGFLPYAFAGQKRGAVAVTAKQANRVAEEEELEMELSTRQRWAGTFLFSQADLLISNALGGKAKLENAGIITKSNFNWSLLNYGKLTRVNWGSRSFAGFVNFSALGFMGDYVSSFYKFDHDLYNKLAGGATSGVLATLFTTLPNSYADRKLLASKMENGRLLTTCPFTMFSQMKSHVQTVGTKEALSTFVKQHFLKEFFVRSPQAALTFAIIFGVDHLMGPEPLKRVWPKQVEEIDSAQSSSMTKKM
jgi:hypothetical protein